MRQRRGRDEIIDTREQCDDARTPRLPLGLKKVKDGHDEDPGSEKPEHCDDDAAQSKRRRALIAHTGGLIRCVMSVHDTDPTESTEATHRIGETFKQKEPHVA